MPDVLFSILLPTRNRAELLGAAISSVLRQTYHRFELIISDNDTEGTRTHDVVQEFTDPRIRYYRTDGQLAMSENWNSALEKAAGTHIIVLEDKQRLVPNTLEVLANVIACNNAAVISYLWDRLDVGSPEQTFALDDQAWKVERHSTKDLIKRFATDEIYVDRLFACGENSCVSRETIKKVKEQSTSGKAFNPLSPDISFGFAICACEEAFWHVAAPLVYSPDFANKDHARYSNGFGLFQKSPETKEYFRHVGVPVQEIVALVPVKSEWLLTNIYLFDYFKHYVSVVGSAAPEINWARYIVTCIQGVRNMRSLGGRTESEDAEIARVLKERGLFFRLSVLGNLVSKISKRKLLRLFRKIRQKRRVRLVAIGKASAGLN